MKIFSLFTGYFEILTVISGEIKNLKKISWGFQRVASVFLFLNRKVSNEKINWSCLFMLEFNNENVENNQK